MYGLLLVALLASPNVPAKVAEGPRIAVLEFTGGRVDSEALVALADQVRGAAVQEMRPRGYTVMTRESIAVVVREMGGSCTEGECEVETGRNVGAAVVITGAVRVVGDAYLLQLKLHETAKGSLLYAESARGSSVIELVDRAHAATLTLLRGGLGATTPPPATATFVPAPPASSASAARVGSPGVTVLRSKPGDVSMDHARHAELACTACHDSDRGGAISRVHGKDGGHETCVGCHKRMERGARRCTDCHRR